MAERIHAALSPVAAGGFGRQAGWAMGSHGLRFGGGRETPRTIGPDRVRLEKATAEARVALEEAAYAAVVAAERALTLAAELDAALGALEHQAAPASPTPQSGPHRDPIAELSPREREVLALVAEGRSNKSIAEALFVSPNTIKTHVASLFSKLHAETRAQLAAIAVRRAAL